LRAVLLLSLLLAGCSIPQPQGLIYTHVIEPLDTNMNRTPSSSFGEEGDVKQLAIRSIRVDWDKNAIGVLARKYGMKTVYFADREVFRINLLVASWGQETIHIYGQ